MTAPTVALTLHQPYASLIVAGIKTWETRPLAPHGDMRWLGESGLPGCRINRDDRVAIHAAAADLVLGWADEGGE